MFDLIGLPAGLFDHNGKKLLSLFRKIIPKNGIIPTTKNRDFKRLVEPIYFTCEQIHMDYTMMLRSCLATLEEISRSNPGFPFDLKKKEISTLVSTKRKKKERVRQQTRVDLDKILPQLNDFNHRYFLICVAQYIINSASIRSNEHLIEIWAENLNFKCDTYFNSPSMELLKSINESNIEQ